MKKNEDSITIREASEGDFPQIAELLNRHHYIPEQPDWSSPDYLKWLQWKLLENPDGRGRVFVADDSSRGIIGLNPFLPRLFTSAATGEFLGYHGIDAFVDPEMRGKNAYSRIYLYAMDVLNAPKVSFPSNVAMRVTVREGAQTVSPFDKWSFPLMIARPALGPISFVANAFLKFYAFVWLGGRASNVEMKRITEFERGFQLDPAFIHGVRSAAFLNWRFIRNPLHAYLAYEFIEGGESIGYWVYRVKRSNAEIYDFVVTRRPRACLRMLVEHCRAEGLARLIFRGINLRMRGFGFMRGRERNSSFTIFRVPHGPWMITLADRDY
jgi:hypothetical protein